MHTNPEEYQANFKSKSPNKVIEYVRVYNDKIVVYPSFEMFNTMRGHSSKSLDNLRMGVEIGSSGEIKAKGKRKIDSYVNIWVTSVIHYMRLKRIPQKLRYKYLTFVTLTLSSKQIHDDREIKRECFNWFMTDLRRQYSVKTYLWVAELQKNGNIHFHILVDRPIHHKEVRNLWNKAQEKLGYISAFESKNGHRDPNSTDIHSLKSIQNPSAYITKYMSKQESPQRKIEGRVWGSSKNLISVNSFQGFASDFSEDIKNAVNSGVDYFDSDYFTIYNTWRKDKKTVESLVSKENFIKIRAHYVKQFRILYGM